MTEHGNNVITRVSASASAVMIPVGQGAALMIFYILSGCFVVEHDEAACNITT